MDEQKLKFRIRKQWDIQGLIADLREQKWQRTESSRIDRLRWIGSYEKIESLAKEAFTSKEWNEAAKEGFENEIVDEYLEALGNAISDGMGKELRREHVYTTIEDGDVWIGQYEDMSAEELQAMGFEIEV